MNAHSSLFALFLVLFAVPAAAQEVQTRAVPVATERVQPAWFLHPIEGIPTADSQVTQIAAATGGNVQIPTELLYQWYVEPLVIETPLGAVSDSLRLLIAGATVQTELEQLPWPNIELSYRSSSNVLYDIRYYETFVAGIQLPAMDATSSSVGGNLAVQVAVSYLESGEGGASSIETTSPKTRW